MALRMGELSPREFEELCAALLRAENHETRHLGAGGKEGGWDVRRGRLASSIAAQVLGAMQRSDAQPQEIEGLVAKLQVARRNQP